MNPGVQVNNPNRSRSSPDQLNTLAHLAASDWNLHRMSSQAFKSQIAASDLGDLAFLLRLRTGLFRGHSLRMIILTFVSASSGLRVRFLPCFNFLIKISNFWPFCERSFAKMLCKHMRQPSKIAQISVCVFSSLLSDSFGRIDKTQNILA